MFSQNNNFRRSSVVRGNSDPAIRFLEGLKVALFLNLVAEKQHPKTDLQPKRWGTRTGVGLGIEPRAAQL